jgi:predicted DNA-binding protein with PD1-like motif
MTQGEIISLGGNGLQTDNMQPFHIHRSEAPGGSCHR